MTVRLAALALALLLLAPAAARAEEPVPEARDLFKEGVAALRADDYPAAARAFGRSHALEPRAATLCNLALTYDRWPGHEREAAGAYEQCAAEDDSGRYREHARARAGILRGDETGTGTGTGAGAGTGTGAGAGAGTDRRSRPLRTAAIVTASVSAASFVGGLLLVAQAHSDADALERRYGTEIPAGSPGEDQLDSARRSARVGVALYVVAGALAATSATLLVLDITRKGDRAPGATVRIAPTAGGALVTTTIPLP